MLIEPRFTDTARTPLEIEKLAEDAASLLISNATTDLWSVLRDRVPRLLSRSNPLRRTRLERELDELREAVANLSDGRSAPKSPAYFAGLWQARVIGALEDDPEAARELASFLERHGSARSDSNAGVLIRDVQASGNAVQIIVGNGGLTIGGIAERAVSASSTTTGTGAR
ncbi:hypothetical protein [Glycomyces terrestris]|uniref:Uncharacterized protein n=1 Tax=Glycomyces terrestris TaxID=2493553 RepID=A0A426UZZ9_9ACTN|nr:hypothetical protein [Glycomyces terrestris]RRS00184.1 hypothetical protein EIW28_06220 [Glycomyces terrestris]